MLRSSAPHDESRRTHRLSNRLLKRRSPRMGGLRDGASRAGLELVLGEHLGASLLGRGTALADRVAEGGSLRVDELTDMTGVDETQAKALIMKAREHWFTA